MSAEVPAQIRGRVSAAFASAQKWAVMRLGFKNASSCFTGWFFLGTSDHDIL